MTSPINCIVSWLCINLASLTKIMYVVVLFSKSNILNNNKYTNMICSQLRETHLREAHLSESKSQSVKLSKSLDEAFPIKWIVWC